jgi:hypothetical protein
MRFGRLVRYSQKNSAQAALAIYSGYPLGPSKKSPAGEGGAREKRKLQGAAILAGPPLRVCGERGND